MEIIIVIGKSPWKNNHTIRSFPGEEKGLSHCGSPFCVIRRNKILELQRIISSRMQ